MKKSKVTKVDVTNYEYDKMLNNIYKIKHTYKKIYIFNIINLKNNELI